MNNTQHEKDTAMTTKIDPFLSKVTLAAAITLVMVGMWVLPGCGEPHIYFPEPEQELTCRTISVDECFSVQCGYAPTDGVFVVVANELFCPEDYCPWPESGTVCMPIDFFNRAKQVATQRGVDSVKCFTQQWQETLNECNTALNECNYDLEACADYNECPVPDVVEPGDDGYCDLSVPVGHRPIECRGKDHAR